MTLRTIERVVNQDVSPAMLDMAKDLRRIAADIESGIVVAVGVAAVENIDGDISCSRIHTAVNNRFTLLGALTVLTAVISQQLIREAEEDG